MYLIQMIGNNRALNFEGYSYFLYGFADNWTITRTNLFCIKN